MAVPNKAHTEVAQYDVAANSTHTVIRSAMLLVIDARKAENKVNA